MVASEYRPAHPDESRDMAYQLWAFVAGRNATEVARLLASDAYGSHTVPARTVQHWASTEGWAERARDDVHRIAPDIRYQTFSELMFGALDGARYIRQVSAGSIDADKLRLTASIAAVDRVGFSPVSKGAVEIAPPQEQAEVHSIPSLTGLSPDELMRLEQQARDGKQR
jgi:hypothetical protein